VKEYKAARQLNPNSTDNLYGTGLPGLGGLRRAKAAFNQITDLALGNYGGFYGLGQIYSLGRIEEEIAQDPEVEKKRRAYQSTA
jgi:hypothetical protein